MGQMHQIKMLVIGTMELHTYDEPSTPPKIFYILFIQVIYTRDLWPTTWRQQILPGKAYLHPSGVAEEAPTGDSIIAQHDVEGTIEPSTEGQGP
jgi:hypothetical protein